MKKLKNNIDYWLGAMNNLPDSYRKWFQEEKLYLNGIITNDAKVLEVGCGDGRSISDIATRTKNVTGIDYDLTAVSKASQRFSSEKTIKIIKADATNLPFENETYDFVICMVTFVNFDDKKQVALSEMKRVLKKGGKIIISAFSEDALEERMKLYRASGPIKSIENGKVTFGLEFKFNVSEQFSEAELRAIFSEAKLKVVDITRLDISYLCCLE